MLDADDGREVVDEIRPRHDTFENVRLENGLADHAESGPLPQVADLQVGGQVEHRDLVSTIEKRLGEVRAYEPRPAGDEHFHARILTLPSVRDRRAGAHAHAPTPRPLPRDTRPLAPG